MMGVTEKQGSVLLALDDLARAMQADDAATLSRAAAESSGLAWQGLLTVREDWEG